MKIYSTFYDRHHIYHRLYHHDERMNIFTSDKYIYEILKSNSITWAGRGKVLPGNFECKILTNKIRRIRNVDV